MKSVKRISSLLLALFMILTMSVTTFAAGTTGSITIDNPVQGKTYTAYKIFDVVYSGDKQAYSYTIDRESEWFSAVQSYADDETKGLTLTPVTGTTTYIVETGSAFSVSDFSSALQKVDTSRKTEGKTLTDDGSGKASVSNLDLGYYFVTSGSGALCNLTTTDPNVTIHDKMNVPFKKTEDKTFADVGDKVTYTITGKVPEYAGFSSYTYLITDIMSDGLTFNQESVKVMVGSVDKTTDCTIEKNVGSNPNKFTVSIPVMTEKYKVGAEIKVTYTATLNEKAVAIISTNKATLTYSNNPTDSTKKTTTPPQEKKVYSSKIEIVKYDKDNQSKKLSGAEFVLYKKAADSSNLYYKWNDATNKVEWVAAKDVATKKTTDSNGAAYFEGLADGTYYLEETKAPAGYNPLSEPKEIKVTGSDTDDSKLTIKEGVANSTGTILPSTGGMGTTFFYVIGGIFVLASVVLLITRKRMEKVEK